MFTAPPPEPEPENSQPSRPMTSRSRTTPPTPPIQGQGIDFFAEGFFLRRGRRAGRAAPSAGPSGGGPAVRGPSSAARGMGSGRGGGGGLGRVLNARVVWHDGHFTGWRVASGGNGRGSPHRGQ